MDLIIENFGLLLLLGLGFASWLKSRVEAKQEEEAERRAREEMVRHLQEQDNRPVYKTSPPPVQRTSPPPVQRTSPPPVQRTSPPPVQRTSPPPTQRTSPPPVPQGWDTRPPAPSQPEAESTPASLRDLFKEVLESVAPPIPAAAQKKERERDAYDDEPAPWKGFQHREASLSEIDDVDHDPLESPMLRRQLEMQERLTQIKKETAQFKGKVAGARETQRRVAHKNQPKEQLIPLGSLRSTLKDKRQVKRAVILREILGQPVGMRSASDSLW